MKTTHHLSRRLLLLGMFALSGPMFHASGQTNSPQPAPESAFTPIFNGVDLTGWEGDPAIWSVQEGTIAGRLDRVPSGDRFLVWKGGELGNFELRFSYWEPADQIPKNGSNGIRFRARRIAGQSVFGYDLGIMGLPRNHAYLDEISDSGKSRGLVYAGQSTVNREINGTNMMEVVGRVATTPEQLQAGFRLGDWNQIGILAQSNRIQVRINGQLLHDCTDANEAMWRASGLLALKVWMNQGPVVTARFKDLRLRRLAPGEVIPATPIQTIPVQPGETKPSAAERLKQVKALYDQGLINKDDYDKKVKEIMDSL